MAGCKAICGEMRTHRALNGNLPWASALACVDLDDLWTVAYNGDAELEEEVVNNDDDMSRNSLTVDDQGERANPETALNDPEQGEEVSVQPADISPRQVQDKTTRTAESQPPTRTEGGKTGVLLLYFKYAYSAALLAFSIAILAAAIFTRQTTGTALFNIQPVLAFGLFWFLILYLALIEAGLNCMVGLKSVDPALYKDSHPLAYKCTQLTNRGDNLDRFIIGRQFLDYSSVFMTNLMVSSVKGVPLDVLGLPQGISEVFLRAGFAVCLVTIVIGQLVSQMNAAHCKLDWINNWLMVGSTYAALAIEDSGLLHATYLLRRLVGKIAGQPIESAEAELGSWGKAWFWTRALGSLALLVFSVAATIRAIFDGKTSMWPGVPVPVSIILLVALIVVMGFMDALQIAVYKVLYMSDEELAKHPVAHFNTRFALRGTNLRAFLIGRQVFQTVVLFVIARIISIRVHKGEENVFGISDGLQKFFNFGILGAFLSTILASLSWRILANSFPLAFLSTPFTLFSIRFCLFVENTGLCAISWIIAAVTQKLLRLKHDEIYIGTAADRAAAAAADKNDCLDISEGQSTSSDSSNQSDVL